LSTTRLNRAFLETLVRHGTFGTNPADAAERLVSSMIANLRHGDDLVARCLDDTWRAFEREEEKKRSLGDMPPEPEVP
jgi:hypothetical protein